MGDDIKPDPIKNLTEEEVKDLLSSYYVTFDSSLRYASSYEGFLGKLREILDRLTGRFRLEQRISEIMVYERILELLGQGNSIKKVRREVQERVSRDRNNPKRF